MEEKHTRLTRQKSLMLAVFSERRGEDLTAEEVLAALDANGTHIGLATVYRNLSAFEQEGKLIRVVAGSTASTRYRYAGEKEAIYSHYHMVCTACGELAPFDKEILARMERAVSEKTGYAVTDRQVLFYGICPACRHRMQLHQK